MNLLRELNDLLQPKVEVKITEHKDDDREEKDLGELVDAYLEGNRMYHFEGSRGVSNFDKLISVMGYRNMDEFLSDNSGCIEAMIEWIKDAKVDEWKDAFAKEVPEEK